MFDNNIIVEVHCLKPSWVSYEKNKYRIYVNDNLLTERRWYWDLNTYLQENIWVRLCNGHHSIRVEPVQDPVDSSVQFVFRNLTVNNVSVPDWGGERMELSFLL